MTTTKMLTLADIVEGLGGTRPAGLDQPVPRAVIDSRDAEPQALFFAMRGTQADGHDYVADAFTRGAVAAVVDRSVEIDAQCVDLGQEPLTLPADWSLPLLLRVPDTRQGLRRLAAYWRRRHSSRVIGITGSVGKTTTKELTAAVLARRYCTLKSEGSYNNEIGLPLTLLALRAEHERVVLEMGMYDVGEIRELAEIALPQVGVVTIVGPVHLERAGSIENIVAAKTELVQALPPPPEGVAILNYDDERVRGMAAATAARVLTYGLSPQADLWADRIEGLGLQGVRFRLHHQKERLFVRVPLLGRHSVHTALRAAAVGLVEGMDWQEIVEGLHGPSPQLRLVAVPGPDGATVLDDTYNASPESTIAALNLLDELEGRHIAVLGDMLELGDYEEEGHRKVGIRACMVADELIAVGRLGSIIGQEALACGMPAGRVHFAADNAVAIDLLRSMVHAGDIVLVKGSRGMHMDEIVATLGRS